MKLIYSGLEAEIYNERRKPSFEYVNFYLTLAKMPGVEVLEYPFDTIVNKGKIAWNAELFELVVREKPDVFFAFMYTDELNSATLDRIRKETKTKVVGWFADDYWRFWNYSRFWSPHMDLVVTTSHEALVWYRRAGSQNVMLLQWAANPTIFHPEDVVQDIDVSFVGQYRPARARLIRALEDEGVRIQTFGLGWPSGRVPADKLRTIFSRSKINLNLNDRRNLFDPWVLGRVAFRKSRNQIVPDLHFVRNLRAWFHLQTPHIHARPFELAACGAFVLSGFAEGMDRYYAPDKEMVFFRSPSELVAKTKQYLVRQDDRERIARAGYERTLREHTYEKRFAEVFSRLGFLE